MSTALLELRDIEKTYAGPPQVKALSGVTLSVRGGEVVAIVGSSGSGKSTLLNIMGLLDEPTAGSCHVGGVRTDELTERERTAIRAARIGFVFQAFHLIGHLTCQQNVMLPLIHQGWPTQERKSLARAALDAVGLTHRLEARPATLSGGEQQRVAVARAIVHNPALVLCDEPTGNLDSENTATVLNLLRGQVSPERAVVIVTHEQAIRDGADRYVEVVDGRAAA